MRRIWITLAVAVTFASCGEDSATGVVEPITGSLTVMVLMDGLDPDPDGFRVSLNGGALRSEMAEDSVTLDDLATGTHSVLLEDVASNCTVEGDNPRSVEVAAGATTPLTFTLKCSLLVQIVDLGTLGGTKAGAYAINDHGQVAGWSRDQHYSMNLGFVWEDGVMAHLDSFGGPAGGRDVNDHGQVVGYSEGTFEGDCCYDHAFLWEDGVMIDLGTLGDPYRNSYATAINNRGQVVGYSNPADSFSRWIVHAFLWENGVMVDLGTLGGDMSKAYDISEEGKVVGYSETESRDDHAFLWENGVMIDLGTLGGDESEAHGINEQRQVVGFSQTASRENRAFLWENGVMIDLGTLGGSVSEAYGINDLGIVVGRSTTANGAYHAFLWQDGSMYDLGPAGGHESCAYDVNNHGIVVGTSEDSRAVMWTR